MMHRPRTVEMKVPGPLGPWIFESELDEQPFGTFRDPRTVLADACCVLVFTDLVGSTTLVERLGDTAGAGLLDGYARVVRRAIRLHQGVELRAAGDGFVVSFRSARRALRFALAIRAGLEELNRLHPETVLAVRTGIHAGEPVAGDDLQGVVLHKAARIMASAAPGQILSSDVVRQLADGKNFEFVDQGDLALRGCAVAVRVHEVRGERESDHALAWTGSAARGESNGHGADGPAHDPCRRVSTTNGVATDVLVVHEQCMMREGLTALLESDPDLRVVGATTGGGKAVELGRALAPDVVVMQIGGGDTDGIATARHLVGECPRAAIVALGETDVEALAEALRTGIRGYLSRRCTSAELLEAVRTVAGGGRHVDTALAGALVGLVRPDTPAAGTPHDLTAREREILQLVAEGNTNPQIAARLGLTRRTIETHRTHLMRKLGLHCTADVVRCAVGRGVVRVDA